VTQRPAGLPSPEQVIELLESEFARAGYEIENVEISDRGGPPCIRIVADGDRPPNLDAVADLSRLASVLLDEADTGQTPYLLEVSSPGVDRPLTDEKHFRRNRGRRVEVKLDDGVVLTGRLGAAAGGVIELVVRAGGGWSLRRIPLTDIRNAVVQVDFSAPSAGELKLIGGTAETEAEA